MQSDLTADTCYAFAGQQAGEYTVSVLRAGAELAQKKVPVVVGECGVEEAKVTVRLAAP